MSINRWIKKLGYMYTMKYYSAIKKNAFGSVVVKWMNLELVIQNEVSKKRKTNNLIKKWGKDLNRQLTNT